MDERNPRGISEVQAENTQKKIELVTQALERNLDFISNCDNKASIVLALVGILLTFLLSNDGLESIVRIVRAHSNTSSGRADFLFWLLILSSLGLLVGISLLVSILLGIRKPMGTKKSKDDSLIFFEGIASRTAEGYEKDVQSADEETFLAQLVENLYINAKIAKIKYDRLDWGIIFAFVSFAFLIGIIFVSEYLGWRIYSVAI